MTLCLLALPTARRLLVGLLVFGLVGLSAEAGTAGAPSLPAAIYRGYAPNPPTVGSPPELTHAGTYAQADSRGSYSFSITLAGAPSPFASAGVTSGGLQISASGELFYYFEIVGPAGATPVNLDLTALLTTTSYGTGSAGAVMQIEQVSGISFVYSSAGTACSLAEPCAVKGADWGACSAAESAALCSGEPASLNLSTTESLDSNTTYQVELATGADTPTLGLKSLAGGGKGVIDPHFAVDPSTPDAGAYSLAFSAGIANSSTSPTTVPEPSSWILLSVGFAGAGFFRFARKGLPQARA